MTVLPVIVRELRASARQPFTYYLRVLGVAASLSVSLLYGLVQGFTPGFGRELFLALHATLFGAIWVLVPMLTADCISRERREGTLGLLFLTPLKGRDIVVAKGLAHGLRAMTLGLAVLPTLTFPFLVGGVSWTEAAFSAVVNANAMCWALAAGLLASAWSKTWAQALVGAAMLTFSFLVILGTGAGWFLLHALNANPSARFGMSWDHSLEAGFYIFSGVREKLGGSPYYGLGSAAQVVVAIGQTTLFSILALVVAVLIAGVGTRRAWRQEPPARWRVWLVRVFCTPVLWLRFFRRWMRRKLERNPIGWLEQRTWSGRLVTWGWVAVLVSLYTTMLTDRHLTWVSNAIQEMMAWLLAASIAASAAGSFRRERETGVLELLLVSPLGESRIISGRLRGLWSQFLPAAGLLLSVWLYCLSFLPDRPRAGVFFFYAVTFLNLPVVGLYYSLRCRNFLTAFLFTMGVGLLLPLALAELISFMRWAYGNTSYGFGPQLRASVVAALCQGLLAAYCGWRLYRCLKQRAFPLDRTLG